MDNNARLNLLVTTDGDLKSIDRAGNVLRCSLFPGSNTEFEKVFFQQVLWPGEKSSEEEFVLSKFLIKKLKLDECEECPSPSIEFPFSEKIFNNENYNFTNKSFIHFDFSILPSSKLEQVISNEVLCEPIDCDDIITHIDNIGVDKRLPNEREKEFDKKIDLLDPILHENNAIRQCYEYTR